MRQFLFSADMKLADVIQSDYHLLLLLPRFGMNLGFGDKTVEECCQINGVSTSLFLMISNIYTQTEYFPCEEEIENTDVHQLIAYLQRSHQYYLQKRMSVIRQQLGQLAECCEIPHKTVLVRFFEEYKNEVINHFEYEENTVFPYIHELIEGHPSTNYNIDVFEKNHSNIDDKLNDLKSIIIKYLPDLSSSGERISVLFNIFSLEDDLCKHSLIEDKILIPLVQKLEIRYEKR